MGGTGSRTMDEPTRLDGELSVPSQGSVSKADWLKDQIRRSAGARLGRYTLLRTLGEGGMGVVFAAYDEELDRKVAIKLLRGDVKSGDGADGWLRNEAVAMARLSHPNIVQVYDIGEADGAYFVAMELISGESLRDWLARPRRDWREALAIFMQAGQGLNAAHEGGLVHCDFKPQNVLVGNDGRVRVLDFGLAQLRERDRARPMRTTRAGTETSRLSMIAGTPAYMAPELFLQATPDARSDQFAFCVALHEGLYGARPFTGTTFEEVRRAICSGELTPPPPSAKVPAWLRRVVLRGLALDPTARWPSMKILLGQLSRDPARAARRVLLVSGVAALAGLAVTSVLQRRELEAELAAQRCSAPPVDAWSPERREDTRASLARSGLSFAEDTWQRVSARLDSYAAAWSAMREEACEANRTGAESDLLYERRVACLEQSRDELTALVDVLAAADKDVVGKAVRATLELRPLERCADSFALLASISPPATPEATATVARLRKELAAARAEWSAGRGKSARDRLKTLEPEIARASYKPLTAEAHYLIGVTADMLGDYASAAAALEVGFLAAEASHHNSVAIEAAIRLLFVVGYRLSKLDEAGLWERLTEAIMERQGNPSEYESRWLSMRGTIRIRAGKLDEAAEFLNSARLSAEAKFGPTSLEVASILNNLGSLSGIQGDHASAEAYSRRALDLLAGILGPDHPDLATLYVNCGAASFSQGRLDEARADFKRALAILGRSVGLDSPDAARLYHNLGGAHARAGEYDEALAVLLHAVELRRRLLGELHTDTANTEGTVGETYLELRRPEEALPYVERALAGHRASVGEKHLRYAAAQALHGRVLLELGRDDLAIAELEGALTILAAGAAPREQLGSARFALARARWSSLRTQGEALALADQAREDFIAAGPLFDREIKDIERWLERRRLAPADAP